MSVLIVGQPCLIESEAEYEAALGISKELMVKKHRSQTDTRLLKTWVVLIRDYERRRYPEMFRESEPREVLQFLLEENELGQSDIPGISQPRISDMLAGRRSISLQQARMLGEFFRTDFSLFL